MADDIYVVEKILKKRQLENGRIEYFLKWFGFEENDATWEPEENIFCKDLIEQYEYRNKFHQIEKNLVRDCEEILRTICGQIEIRLQTDPQEIDLSGILRDIARVDREAEINANQLFNDHSMATKKRRLDDLDYLSMKPERIVSITRSRTSTDQLEFLLKCRTHPTRLYFISNDKAKELIPDLLIEFYERHINWFLDRRKS